ncbi:MAG TPA: sigma 54-interacting transcriptional regulator [Polyangia bacterium]|jgi:DNA-binding NtrC family response regulator
MATDNSDQARLLGPTTPFLEAPKLLGERHRLIVWLGDTVTTWPLPSNGAAVIGRSPEATIQISSPMVSRQHARLVINPRLAMISDQGSQNGTRVNGERIQGDRLLTYGDIIGFGDVTAAFVEDRGEGGERKAAAALGEGRQIELGDKTVLVADDSMLNLYGQLEMLAPSELSVLVLGETGTGKELAASALHFWSRRGRQALVTINCASLPEALAESELFGHERGAFSGAIQAKPGLLESAAGGTVFLDEIGDLAPPVQAKLLRVLEARRVTRLGSIQERQIDIRVVAATHRNLLDDVKAGRFREDLYYRLGAAVVRVPALRFRRREIPILARAFVERARHALGRPPLAFSEKAMELLRDHPWPGNVRELKNLADYLAATVAEPVILPNHLDERLGVSTGVEQTMVTLGPPDVPTGRSRTVDVRPLADANRQFERERIVSAMEATGGNKTQAARLLGVPLRTFMEKVKRHGLG